jgi:hypothetical protein
MQRWKYLWNVENCGCCGMKEIDWSFKRICKNIRSLDNVVISLIKYWSKIKYNSNPDIIHLIVPSDNSSLPLQIQTRDLNLMIIKENDGYGGEWQTKFDCY